jgi:hypothetical protein
VTTLCSWISGRRPTPPADLAVRLRMESTAVPLHEALAAEGRERLARARSRTGRIRESAFVLLEADALMTYACEAALAAEDPAAALRHVLTVSAEE